MVKLIAYSSVTKSPIHLAMAQQVLKHLTGRESKITIESVIKKTADYFSLQPAQLKSRINERRIAYPRQIAMYIAKEITGGSLPTIGRAFGGKHHTTVAFTINKIERLRHGDGDLNRLIQGIIDSLQ